MSNYDAGHYFLTMMAPIRRGHADGKRHTDSSHVTALRLDLRALPTARQDGATRDSPLDSPFARVPGVHFARFFILDQLQYNGRRPTNAVYNLIFGVNLVAAERVDEFENAWLVMTVDMDAADGSDASLRSCADRLWQGMEPELRGIFGHCLGFDDATIRNADDWYAYLRRCQVTTTMPYNDYWTGDPPPSPFKLYLIGATAVVLGAAALAVWQDLWPFGWVSLVFAMILAWVLTAIGIVLRLGTTPFPAAPDSDLASVLKALHIQQRFSRFAMAQQGTDPAALQAAFAAFVEAERPQDLQRPTQAAGRLPPADTQGSASP